MYNTRYPIRGRKRINPFANPRGRRNFQIRIREEDARSIRARSTRGNWIEIGQTWRRKSCTPPVRTLSTLDGRTGIQVKRIYIYIHISTVSSRKLKLLYQTAAQLAADFSCNTCLSRDSRVSSRGFPAKLSSLALREFLQKIDRNRVENGWKRMESSIEMKTIDCPGKGWTRDKEKQQSWLMEFYFMHAPSLRSFVRLSKPTNEKPRAFNYCDLSQ